MGKEKQSFSVVKYIFFGFNVLVWLLGCGVLAVSVWLWGSRGTSSAIIPVYSFMSISSILIVASVIVIVIGFMGCCGAFLENQCLLIGYFVLVILVFALEISAGTLGYVKKEQIHNLIHKELSEGLHYDYRTEVQFTQQVENRSSYDMDIKGWSVTLDSLQKELKCCGVNNYTDWYSIHAWPEEQRVPESCCERPSPQCITAGPGLWHSRGCMEELEYWLKQNLYILVVACVIVASVQILAMVAAIAQFCYIRSKRFPL